MRPSPFTHLHADGLVRLLNLAVLLLIVDALVVPIYLARYIALVRVSASRAATATALFLETAATATAHFS